MKINVQLSAHEAYLVTKCLEFIQSNLTFDGDTGLRRFIGGGSFTCDLDDYLNLGYIAGKVDELREDAVNYHPFNPYISAF